MGRDDEPRPSSSRNLYWEVFFSLEGAELAEFVGFFAAGLGATGLVSTFLGLGLGDAGAGVAAAALGLGAGLLFVELVSGTLGAFWGALAGAFDDLVGFLGVLWTWGAVVGFCLSPLVFRRMGLKAEDR